MDTPELDIMKLTARAPWREAVTYRETWPHEYVLIQKDGQQELLAEFCRRILRGEGIEGHFFHQTSPYPEIRAWMLETLPKFRDVFNPCLEKILADLETE